MDLNDMDTYDGSDCNPVNQTIGKGDFNATEWLLKRKLMDRSNDLDPLVYTLDMIWYMSLVVILAMLITMIYQMICFMRRPPKTVQGPLTQQQHQQQQQQQHQQCPIIFNRGQRFIIPETFA